jgi:hypothetical protein
MILASVPFVHFRPSSLPEFSSTLALPITQLQFLLSRICIVIIIGVRLPVSFQQNGNLLRKEHIQHKQFLKSLKCRG